MNRLLRAVASQAWAMSPEYVDAMLGVLSSRLEGKLSAEDVEARIHPNREKSIANSDGSIAVIPVRGVISNRASMIEDVSVGAGTSAERITSNVREAMGDSQIKAIVLDVDSPGGAAAGTPEAADAIREMRGGRKPIVAQVQGQAASAAYWIASAADEIVATQSSQVGSIGVLSVHESVAKMLEDEGIEETIISAGRYKADGNPYEPLSDTAREHMQDMVDKYYAMFVDAVAAGRGVDKGRVESRYGQGRSMLAGDADEVGMIDRVGTMQETIERLGGRLEGGRQRQRAGNARSVALARRRLNLEAAR